MGILVQHDLVERVLEVVRFNDWLMKIKILVGKTVCHIYSAYAPQVGRTAQEKEAFWEKLEDEVGSMSNPECLVITGDLNGHIGVERRGYEDAIGPYSFGSKNPEGEKILEFCMNQRLKILNTFFKKDRNKVVTYSSGDSETQIDFVLMRQSTGVVVTDCKAIPGECCVTQHRPVRVDVKIDHMERRKVGGRRKLKTWRLEEDGVREEFMDRLQPKLDESGSE